MQAFTQKTLYQTVAVGALLAVAVAAAVVFQAQLKQTQADAQGLTQAESDFTRLQADLVRWQKAREAARTDLALRQEPLNLSVALLPEELYQLPPILSKVFDPQGYFMLKQFGFEWKTDKEGATAQGTALAGLMQAGLPPGAANARPAPTLAHITLQGDRTLILNSGKAAP